MNNRMMNNALLKRRFGVDGYGNADLPQKISGAQISRIFAEQRGECPFCFPHGYEASNATWRKNTRSWKKNRKQQYRGERINS